MVTMSTVGYGDIACVTALGRGFQVLFLLVGLVSSLWFSVLSYKVFKHVCTKYWKLILICLKTWIGELWTRSEVYQKIMITNQFLKSLEYKSTSYLFNFQALFAGSIPEIINIVKSFPKYNGYYVSDRGRRHVQHQNNLIILSPPRLKLLDLE